MAGIDFTDPRSLENDDLRDLLKVTQANLERNAALQVLQNRHQYPICNRWFAGDKMTIDSGTSIIRNVQVTETGNATWTTPYTPKGVTVGDVQARLRTEWVQLTSDYSISRQEMMRNRSPARLIELVKSRRVDCFMDLAEKLEARAWVAPDSSTDKLHPLGIPYWFVPITGAQVTAATYGHQGVHATGFSDCAGISASTYTRWKSYNDVWDTTDGTITDTSITKVTRMLRRLHFESPMFVTDVDKGSYRDLRLYGTETTIEALEDRARKNNDNLGNDVGRFANATVIKNIPVIWAEELGANTSYPLYAVNHEYFYPFVMEGDNFRETGPMNSRELHDVFTTHVDLQFNFVCVNRQRGGGVISYVAAA